MNDSDLDEIHVNNRDKVWFILRLNYNYEVLSWMTEIWMKSHSK